MFFQRRKAGRNEEMFRKIFQAQCVFRDVQDGLIVEHHDARELHFHSPHQPLNKSTSHQTLKPTSPTRTTLSKVSRWVMRVFYVRSRARRPFPRHLLPFPPRTASWRKAL